MNDKLFELGLDAGDATRRFMGKQDLFVKSLKRFTADIAANGVISVKEAMTMDREDFRKYIHGLKGVTANLSMLKVNALLIEIEKSVKEGNPDFVKYKYFHTTFPKTAKAILDLIILEEGPEGEKTLGAEEECREYLTKLNKFLMMGIARECEEIAKLLREKTWDHIDNDILIGICDAVDGYDYAKALEMIDEVR